MLLAITLCALPLVASAQATTPTPATFTSKGSSIKFKAYTSIFDAEGTFKKWTVTGNVDPENFERSRITLKAQTKTIDTDSGSRDKHLRSKDFFWVSKYPALTWKVISIKKTGKGRFIVRGNLTIKNVTRSLRLPVVVTTTAKQVRVKGKFAINRQSVGIDYKSGTFEPDLKDRIDLNFDLRFNR